MTTSPTRRRRSPTTRRSLALTIALTAAATGLLVAPAPASAAAPVGSTASVTATATGSAQAPAHRTKDSEEHNVLDRAWTRIKGWISNDDSATEPDDTPGSASSAESSGSAAENPGEMADAPSESDARTTKSTDASAASSADDTAMPTGDLPGWTQVFADDFTTAVSLGSFPGPAYEANWGGYAGTDDTSGAGTYAPSDVLSVADGMLDMSLGTKDGTPVSAAPMPQLEGRFGGWTYGRYSVRFRADAVPGYKVAWLLWPDSANWDEGEIDFPEGDLDGTIQAFDHQVGSPTNNALAVDTKSTFTDWHTSTIEWAPDGVTFFLNGVEVGHSKVSPSTPMHFVLQTETSGGTPPSDANGHVQVDWVTMYQQAK